MLLQIFALTLVLAPSLVSAAIFPKDTHVKMLDAKSFKRAMKKNETSVVAFVAPWCGHCQRMAPEYSKAALSLYPLIPFYAVDCDVESNKRLCGGQGVQGFPTIKLFPRGNQKPPVSYDSPTRTASAFSNWASKLVPNIAKKLNDPNDITDWASHKVSKPRALLLNKDKMVPLLWQVLSNKYGREIQFASHNDHKGKVYLSMGLKAGEKKASKVVIYPAGSTVPVLYEGLNKFGPLSKFFHSVLDGTADLKVADEETKAEEAVHETQAKQEAHHTLFADGGETIKDGNGTGHDVHGEVGRKENASPQEATKEDTKSEPEAVVASNTGEDEQVIFAAVIETAPTQASVVVEVDEITTTIPSSPSPKPVGQLKSEDAEHPRDEL
ncbi:hypothetical protein PILCRDRAFT_812003 [Piloderma croceum F 1598]|uniref:Thioredoxin domain-containing protein n=1 Tax=Piloderma croceum (strain F 1598) TaxID=765440 RepID=A0A0C3GF13_PILCF|nr:hypothetical protein PILCRDRAFT_812003 [Piloderma croceum F 1598]